MIDSENLDVGRIKLGRRYLTVVRDGVDVQFFWDLRKTKPYVPKGDADPIWQLYSRWRSKFVERRKDRCRRAVPLPMSCKVNLI